MFLELWVSLHKVLLMLQGCGAGTKILGSGSSSWHLKFLAPAPERFGPKNIVLFAQLAFTTNYVC